MSDEERWERHLASIPQAKRQQYLGRPIVEMTCPACNGLKTVDHRYGVSGAVTAEAPRVHVKACPRCNATGVIPSFPKDITEPNG